MPHVKVWSLALVMTVLLVPAAGATTGGEIIGFLNVQRAVNGIPAGITENPAWSDGCVKHDHYMALNGIVHDEDPAKPGYTAEGDQAGNTSVLYQSDVWTTARNPFEEAPIHLHQLLAPRIDVMGAAETEGFGCATTLASRNRPAPPAAVTYTYPADAATEWPAQQTAREGPYTPGEKLGIPQGTATGPYLYVMVDGPTLTPFDVADITAASLTGPAGPVEVLIVDNFTPDVGNFLPTGGMLIPRNPLAPGSPYTAQISATVQPQGGPAVVFDRTWSFKTGQLPNSVLIKGYAATNLDVTLTTQSDAPGGAVNATGPGGATSSAPIGADQVARLRLPAAGAWHLCAATGGGTSGYKEATNCIDLTVTAPPPPPPVIVKPVAAKLSLVATTVRLRGGRLELAIRCSARCTLQVDASLKRKGKRAARLKRAGTTLGAAGTATLRFKLSAALVKALRRASVRRGARLSFNAKDALGGGTVKGSLRIS